MGLSADKYADADELLWPNSSESLAATATNPATAVGSSEPGRAAGAAANATSAASAG